MIPDWRPGWLLPASSRAEAYLAGLELSPLEVTLETRRLEMCIQAAEDCARTAVLEDACSKKLANENAKLRGELKACRDRLEALREAEGVREGESRHDQEGLAEGEVQAPRPPLE